ncbi:MAG: phosphoribosyltransferase family protein [Nitrospirota bacterium]
MADIIEDKNLRNKSFVFEDRENAGRRISQFLSEYKGSDSIVLSIPSGGVPVGKEIKDALSLPLDLLIVRKIQIPWNPEAGFGAVNLDGYVIFNEPLLHSLELPENVINEQIEKTKDILLKRNELFRKGKGFPSLKNRTAILVDDGLASGYTMIAATEFVKKRNPFRIIIAVPTGSYSTVRKISSLVDHLYCLNIREGSPYSVAEAYRNWYDLSDKEVLRILKGSIV